MDDTLSPRLAFAQAHEKKRTESVAPHHHQALELVYFVKGRGSSAQRGARHDVGPCVFTLTPAGENHDQVNDTRLVSLCFGLLDSGLEPLAGRHRDPGGHLGRVCREILDELEKRAPAWETVVDGLVRQMVGLARRAAASDERPRKQALVEQALEIIDRERGTVTVADLSERLFVSGDYLRHLFQEYAGHSPMRHIIQKRVETAQTLLAAGELSIGEVARRCGFDSPYYFSRLFKQVAGQPPSAWRKAANTKAAAS